MVSHPGAGGARPFLQLVRAHALRGAADSDLVRLVTGGDDAAFRVVAERHGPMVFGVCARLLGNRHDAEDALQATFLVFARRAAAVRGAGSLASWLHGVARRVAGRLRRADRRRLAREHAAAAPDSRPPADDLAWAEVRAGLDEELGRLPDAYRDVLVLCYLEGLTRDEAGRRLGIDPGAVKGRLERGRRLLGDRLTRRGLGLSAGLAALAVAPPAGAAGRVARLAADPAAASPRAAALTHEFLRGVAMSKLKLVTAGLAGALVLAAGVGMGTAQVPADPPPPAKAKADGDPKAKPDPGRPNTPPAPTPGVDDEAFIRTLSKKLRGTDPTPAEIHFFLASRDAGKRGVLAELFTKEGVAKGYGARDREDAAREAEQAARAEAYRARALGVEDKMRALLEGHERERAAAEAERFAAEAKRRAAIDAFGRATRPEKAEKVAPDAADPFKAGPPAADPAKPVPPLPGGTSGGPVPRPGAAPGTPPPAPRGGLSGSPTTGPSPAAPGIEALRIRVQLAELTVREKQLALRHTEELARAGAVNSREADLAKLEVERAQLLLREAQLNLGEAQPASRPMFGR